MVSVSYLSSVRFIQSTAHGTISLVSDLSRVLSTVSLSYLSSVRFI